MVEPVFAWVPSIAISAAMEVRHFHSAWNGDFLVGSLKAQTLFRVHMKDERVVFVEPLWMGHRIRDIVETGSGILILTDEGCVIDLTVDNETLASGRLNQTLLAQSLPPSCTACHVIGTANSNSSTPSLSGVYGRRIGGDRLSFYSDALAHRDGVWDETTLTAFLKDPQQFAPGTTMPDTKLHDSLIKSVVAAFKADAARLHGE